MTRRRQHPAETCHQSFQLATELEESDTGRQDQANPKRTGERANLPSATHQ